MSRININMDSKFIWMFLVGYTVIVKGYQEFSSANCLTEGTVNCSQYIICTEDVDINVYPGRIKTLVYDIYIPRGLTQEASILVSSPPDMAVVISDVHLTYQDDSLTMTNGTYIPVITERTWMLLAFSRQGTYNFGEIDCSGSRVLRNATTEATIVPPRNASHSTDSTSIVTNENARESTLPTTATDSTSTVTNENARETTVPTIATDSNNSTDSMNSTDPTNSSYITTSPNTVNEDPCTYCLVKLAVAYLMADITDVSDNSTRVVTTTMASKNITIEVSTTLMLRIVQNTAVMSNFSTDIPDQVEFLHGYLNKFEIRMNLKSPLSAYKLALSSSDPILKIVSLRTLLIGENYEDIITTVTDQSICSGGSDTKVLDFGYLPNKGYYDSNASSLADIIVFEIILSMKDVVAVGDRFSIYIDMEVDSMEVMNSTKYFNVFSATKVSIELAT
ncbi:uncharacterized protein LOC117314690 [Pecten maximus]|uniref:uncharacterized protein LOC117314690 n=1 Tax=Pecten maximus TaxID=6579 RepID=UPI001458B1C7|nr:uncharacterized protein LOC117314690 [Pecten maximus]